MAAAPRLLPPRFVEKEAWGATSLEPWFPSQSRKIGEVWFEAGPLLVKFLFTSAKLSVQVHPGGPAGKTEMWHILSAEPDAGIALGLHEPVSRERLREAALSGEIERLLNWIPVQPGDTYFVPAGTVHAIGAGLALCEIQQNSDVTYRLYDYGRPRALHLEQALAVASLKPHPGKVVPTGATLVSCPYFVTESLEITGELHYQPDPERFHVLAVLEGSGSLGKERFARGQVWEVPAGAEPFSVVSEERIRMLRTWVPDRS